MGLTLTEKILRSHMVDGHFKTGERIGIRIDQTLTHDVTGVMAYLEFEALGLDRIKNEIAVSYIDHNTLQADFKNPDDHRFLMDIAQRYGIICSKMGNGICHQLHIERFAIPGKTLLGSDSHTPASGGIGMIAIGAGGLDVAMAMAGEAFYLKVPRIINVRLTGELPPYLSIKNLNLEILRRLGVKGCLGCVLEYTGPAAANLNVTQRATVCNMGAETGATSSIFPSDEMTRQWMKAQNRENEWVALAADEDAQYDHVIDIDLSKLQALIALPHQPDNIVCVKEVEGLAVDQVAFGSCTNASLQDVLWIAHCLDKGTIAPNVDAGLYCGTEQVYVEAIKRGAIQTICEAGVRIFEMSCGACNGMGFAPPTNGVSLRTTPRNFKGRSGTPTGQVYLVAPETAAASAVTGVITDPQKKFTTPMHFSMPERFTVCNSRFLYPPEKADATKTIRRGPNIRPLPELGSMGDELVAEVLLDLPDDITTDHIVPAGANFLPIRSNIPEISKHSFNIVDLSFPERAKAAKCGTIIAGKNYGQGSSREQAALVPRYLGIQVIIAESFARIHLANLVNFGILPLIFNSSEDHSMLKQGDRIRIDTLALTENRTYTVSNLSTGPHVSVDCPLTQEELDIVKAGGRLNWIKQKQDAYA